MKVNKTKFVLKKAVLIKKLPVLKKLITKINTY